MQHSGPKLSSVRHPNEVRRSKTPTPKSRSLLPRRSLDEHCFNSSASFYSLSATSITGHPYLFSQLQDKVVLIVNIATEDATFSSHLHSLQHFYTTYQDAGLVVLGFPCNQFYQQPGTNKDISHTLRHKFHVTFPVMSLSQVNGSDTHAVYRWLKQNKRHSLGILIKWNFEKFLITRQGKIYKRYNFSIAAEDIEPDIAKLLQASANDEVEIPVSPQQYYKSL